MTHLLLLLPELLKHLGERPTRRVSVAARAAIIVELDAAEPLHPPERACRLELVSAHGGAVASAGSEQRAAVRERAPVVSAVDGGEELRGTRTGNAPLPVDGRHREQVHARVVGEEERQLCARTQHVEQHAARCRLQHRRPRARAGGERVRAADDAHADEGRAEPSRAEQHGRARVQRVQRGCEGVGDSGAGSHQRTAVHVRGHAQVRVQ
mmetsp:Transcript_10298/g.26788  ORF Transcript_10298/g.26788 Transcript_10298/m.26788 type:complete len:210 (+) Transcript_10298:43-672(+)